MTNVLRLPGAGPRDAARFLIPRTLGFPTIGRKHLFRFTEATLAAGVRDDVTNTLVQPVGDDLSPPTSQTMMPGGGLRVTGKRNLTAGSIDIRVPSTIIVTATIPLPAANASTGILGLGGDFVKGFMLYDAALFGAPPANGLSNTYFFKTLNGAYAGSSISPSPAAGRYGRAVTRIIQHYGGGAFHFEDRLENKITSFDVVVDLETLAGAPGAKVYVQPIILGGFYPGLTSATGIIFDLAGVWTKVLNEQEIQAVIRASADLTVPRSRA